MMELKMGLKELPDLYDEFMVLSVEKREACMRGIENALAAFRDAGLPDVATNILIDWVLSGYANGPAGGRAMVALREGSLFGPVHPARRLRPHSGRMAPAGGYRHPMARCS